MNYGKKGIHAKQKKITSKTKKVGTKAGLTFIKAFMVAALVLVVMLGFAGLGMVKGIIDNAPDISSIDISPTGYATAVYDVNGNEIASIVTSGSNRVYASINEMPDYLINAFIDIEDERFYEHNGIDIKGIARAAYSTIKTKGLSQGASTITQQLIKGKLFNSGMGENTHMETIKRKLQEQYLAINLEKIYSKEEILENYLNMINLGSNTLGVQAASKRYFNKDVWDLTISESAVIAGITQNPTMHNPVTNPDSNNSRRETILGKMLKFGHITQEEYDIAMADDVYSRIQNVNIEFEGSSVYSYFTDELIQQVMIDLQEQKGYTQTQAYYALYSGGLSIYTTQDPEIQAIADEEFANPENFPANTEYSITWAMTVQHADKSTSNYNERTMESYFKTGDDENDLPANRFFKLIFSSKEDADATIEKYKANILSSDDRIIGENIIYTPQPQASFVIMDQYTGYVKAIVGGRGTKETSLSLNRATDTTRQPGSVFKIVSTYAPALDTAGFTLASVQYDEPGYTAPDGTPFSNYNKVYEGFTTVRSAIAKSINVVAVKTIADITPNLAFSYLESFGFTTLVKERVYDNGTSKTDIGQSLALGGITDGVTNLELTASFATIANNGIYIEPILYTKVLDQNGNILLDNTPETHTVIKSTTAFLLTSAMQDVVTSGTGTTTRIPNMPVAGKTGTTSDYNDIWFTGFTPYYTAGIWSGYDENKSQTRTATGNANASSYHKDLWSKIMTRVHENLEYTNFTMPEGIETAVICTKSGKLAVEGLCDHDPRGSMVRTEYFAKGTTPTEVCDNHVKVITCTESNQIATEFCPEESRQEQVYINNIYITETSGETEDTPYILPLDLEQNLCTVHTGHSTEDPDDDDSYENWTPSYPGEEYTSPEDTDIYGPNYGPGFRFFN